MTLKYRNFTIAVVACLSLAGGIATFAPAAMAAHPHQISVATKDRTATFAIENMTCGMCPITVRTAMEHVDGVKSVRVDFDAKTATVDFDPSRATVKTIAAASTNAGYPATVKR